MFPVPRVRYYRWTNPEEKNPNWVCSRVPGQVRGQPHTHSHSPMSRGGIQEDRGSLPFEQNGPKEDIDDLRVVVRICPL